MVSVIETEAIVFKKKELLQKDSLVTLFTKELGKVAIMAKGVRKITSRRSPHLQTANLISVSLSARGDRYFLQQTRLMSGFLKLKDNQKKMNYVYFLFYILDRLLPENQPEERVFSLARGYLVEVAKAQKFGTERLGEYLYRILLTLGYIDQPKPFSDLVLHAEDIIHEKIPVNIL